MTSPAHTRTVGQLLAAALCWSLGGLLIKWVHWPPLAVAAGRGLIAAALLAATHRGLRFRWSALQPGASLLGERATRADWVAIAATFESMALFFADRLEFAGLLGNSIAGGSGFAVAGMAMLLRKQTDGTGIELVILGNPLAAVLGLPALVRAPSLAPDG